MHTSSYEQSQGFEGFINANPKAPEFISLYIDENLKKGVKDVSRFEKRELNPF